MTQKKVQQLDYSKDQKKHIIMGEALTTEEMGEVYLLTLLIGHATGKQTKTRTRTNGATVAPMAKP